MDKLTLTVKEASELTGIGRCKIEELINSEGDFPYFRVGRKILINADMLKDWLSMISKENRVL